MHARCPQAQVVRAPERPAALAALSRGAFCCAGLLERGDVVDGVLAHVSPRFPRSSDASVVRGAEDLAGGECAEDLGVVGRGHGEQSQ